MYVSVGICTMSSVFRIVINRLKLHIKNFGSTAVSYTHLDVYKRQEEEKGLSQILVLKLSPAAELIHIVPHSTYSLSVALNGEVQRHY